MDPEGSKAAATPRQIHRIRWWAKKIGVDAPESLTKEQASRLISEWEDRHPELVDVWDDHKDELEKAKLDRVAARRERAEEREIRELEIDCVAGDVEDWREFYRCKKVSKKLVLAIVEKIGSRGKNEPIDQYMGRFFAQLKVDSQGHFKASPNPPSTSKGGCSLLGAALLFAILLAVISN